MKLLITLIGALCISFTTLLAQQKTKDIDTRNSILNWTGHAEIGSYAPAGTLAFKDGVIRFAGDKVTGATLTVDMKSMNQSNSDLLEHLKSDDFFDVEKYPLSKVEISKISNGKAYGQLTIKNKTVPVVCHVTMQTNAGKTTVRGNMTIDRTGYGIIYNSGSFFSGLGDKAIRNTFDVAFTIVTK